MLVLSGESRFYHHQYLGKAWADAIPALPLPDMTHELSTGHWWKSRMQVTQISDENEPEPRAT